MKFKNPFDPDDKAGLTIVEKDDGLFEVQGCASDNDWFPGIPNQPEFYIKIHHTCKTDVGEFKVVESTFQVFAPYTYDYYINNPIDLD